MTVLRTITVVGAVVVAAATAAGACGGRAVVDNQPAATKRQGTPVVHFLVNERPHDPANAAVDVSDGTTAVRYGDPFHVVVDELAGGARVAIEARLYGMVSRASFVADEDGVVDLSRDAPVDDDGSWTGVDAEALLWSMQEEPGVTPPAQLDLTITVKVIAAAADDGDDGDDDDDDAFDDASVIVEGALARRYINDGLTVEDVADGRTVGALVIPPGDGPFPAVLVFGGSEGGTGSGVFEAMYLGSLGYAALGVGYFGAAGVPARLDEVPIEILEEDLAFLAGDARVDADRIAVMGASRGGELALILGARFPIVKAVVANVPSGVVWPGDSFPDLRSAWTYGGVPLPFMPDVGAFPEVTVDATGASHIVSRPIFLADLDAASGADLAAATIHVEDTGGPILLLGGDVDALWPSCVLADIAFARLSSQPADALDPSSPPHTQRYSADESHCFPDAGHLIGVPGWSTNYAQETYAPDLGAYLVTGGTPAGMGHADRDADTAIRGFLERNL